MRRESVVKEDLHEVDERYIPTVGCQYSNHGDALAHCANTHQRRSAHIRGRSPRNGRLEFVSLGPRLRLWRRLYQFGILQTDGSSHVGLSPDHATAVTGRTGHLWLCSGDRATASHYDAGGVDL